MAKAKKMAGLTSSASDKDIKKFIQALNRKISSYKPNDSKFIGPRTEYDIDASNAIYENFVNKVEAITHFNKWNKGGNGYTEVGIDLKEGKNGYYLPQTKESIEYIRDTLKTQEAAAEKQKQKDPNYVPGKNITESLAALPTMNEKLDTIADQLIDPNRDNLTTPVVVDPKTLPTKKEQRLAAQQNRAAAYAEMQARAMETYDTTFEDDIDALYEDKQANQDLIDRLKTEKWDSSDLMEEVHMRSLGIDTYGF